ncbi:MAG: SLC13 family permease [Candidatus Binatia bacterium]
MTHEQIFVFTVLLFALFLFVTERWRYDVIALLSLLAVVFGGIVPGSKAFLGFGHPAVITVGAVLVVGRALQNAGLVDWLAHWVLKVGERPTLQVMALSGLVAALSGFMNNVGALALLLPVAIRMSRTNGRPPSLLLMPLAFGSLLGGMTTLIGTPPNIIIATFRTESTGAPFRMFDFAPVGIGVALAGLLYMSLLGWRLIPKRKGQLSREELFRIEEYVAEVRVPEGSKAIGQFVRDFESVVEGDVTVVALVRQGHRLLAPSSFETLRPDDILVVEADSETLKALLDAAKLELVGSGEQDGEKLGSEDVSIAEAIVRPQSPLEGNTAWTFNLRWRYGVNLLGVARQGYRLKKRLREIQFEPGDVLLLQGPRETLHETISILGCLPLAERGLRFGPQRIILAVGVFAMAIIGTASGLLAAQTAFLAAAVAMVLVGLISLREAYDSIDWPILVLLGAMIPVGEALETTGGAKLLAGLLLNFTTHLAPTAMLAIVLISAMVMTPLINNAAAAILLAPIAVSIANGIGASVDPFLMAVCVGSSCDFLTPIGHQSNTLVMGPGGYKFSDYSRMGLPLEILIIVVSLPLILWFWPLGL